MKRPTKSWKPIPRLLFIQKILLLVSGGILMTSCGAILQQSGVKNYVPNDIIQKQGLNSYQYDFMYLSKLVEEGFPRIDSIFPRDERQKQLEQALAALATVDNNTDFIVQSRKYLSNLKNQHTRISLSQKFKKVYPFVIHISSDEWFLLNVSTQIDSLLIGKKISEINGHSTTEVEKRLRDFTFGENRINQQIEICDLQLYNKPPYLQQIGVIANNSQPLNLLFEDNSEIDLSPVSTEGKWEVYGISLKNNPITEYQNETYLYTIHEKENFGYLQFNRCHDQTDILEGIDNYVKPWLQPLAMWYVKRQFKKNRPSKRIAKYYNPRHPVFKDFMWEFVDSLNAQKIENIIIDLRNNPGGNLTLGKQLLYFLTDTDTLRGFTEYAFTSDIYKSYFQEEYDALEKRYPEGVPHAALLLTDSGDNVFKQIADESSPYYISKNRPVFKGDIYVLANYRTGSAAAMLTTLVQDNDIGTVIGTSVGNNPVGATTYTPLQLPKTKAQVSIATSYIERPKKEMGTVQVPDIWVEYSIDDLMRGKDPYLEIVKKEIEKPGIHKPERAW